MITFERLRQVVNYNSETGSVTWTTTRGRAVAGHLAGSFSKKKNERSGYIYLFIDGKRYAAHRLIYFWMTGTWPKDVIDHIDGDGTNNRWENLREATRSQNSGNARRSTKNTSGYKGVSRVGSKFIAQIRTNWQTKYLGRFETSEEAAAAYEAAAKNFFKEYARVA